MRFVTATKVSHGSQSKVYKFFLVRSPAGNRMKFIPSKNHFRANMLIFVT
jgi:hypothetical protein